MFVHLHVHSEYSLLDGMCKIKELPTKAKAMGMKALAITDHGVGYGLVEFYNECKKQGIKPLLGCEFYVAPISMEERDNENRYYHLIILVKNETGYKNLCRLITVSNTKGFYYKPRIDFEVLKEHKEGLICLSACLAGEVPCAIKKGQNPMPIINRYRDVFGEDYYLEIQNHGIKEELLVAQELYKISKQTGIKLVCTNDTHYLNSEDAEAHDWLLCMQTDKKVDDPSRMIYEGDYSLKSEEEMRALYPSMPEAFDNTVEVAEKCNFDFVFGEYRMPKVVIPEEYNGDYYKYLADEAWKGFKEKYSKNEAAKERLEYELSVVRQMNFSEYFLDTRKTILWARSHGILVGPGRGSGAGSVMNYCLGITDLEPLKYGLLFERFLNPERISMPDIDVDYQYDRKEDVVASEAESNGKDKFCKIQTFQQMLSKAVLKDVGRVAGIDFGTMNSITKMIPDGKSLAEAWEVEPDLQEVINSSSELKKVWEISLKLEGLKKSAGTHACGHIPTPIPCEELFPCSVDKESGYLVCQYNMVEAEHLGNLKKDLLMLRNLTVIEDAREGIRADLGIDIPLWNNDILNDAETLAMIARGETDGVFQLESEGMKKMLTSLKPDCFEDIIAAVSLYRPGPMEYIPEYVEGKHHPETIAYAVPELEDILKPTYGVIVYQEQVMQIVQKLAGFSMGRADVVRKAMG